MSQNQRRQSIIPLPIPANNSSASEGDDNDMEIIESDNDEVSNIISALCLLICSFSTNLLPLL